MNELRMCPNCETYECFMDAPFCYECLVLVSVGTIRQMFATQQEANEFWGIKGRSIDLPKEEDDQP